MGGGSVTSHRDDVKITPFSVSRPEADQGGCIPPLASFNHVFDE